MARQCREVGNCFICITTKDMHAAIHNLEMKIMNWNKADGDISIRIGLHDIQKNP